MSKLRTSTFWAFSSARLIRVDDRLVLRGRLLEHAVHALRRRCASGRLGDRKKCDGRGRPGGRSGRGLVVDAPALVALVPTT